MKKCFLVFSALLTLVVSDNVPGIATGSASVEKRIEPGMLGSGTLSCSMGGKSTVTINFSGDVNWTVDKIEGDKVTFIKYKCTISQGTFDIQNSTGSFSVSIS